jgi:hypothetical protein
VPASRWPRKPYSNGQVCCRMAPTRLRE